MKFFQVSIFSSFHNPYKGKNHKGDIKLNALLQKYYYTLFHLALCMKGIILWLLLGLFLISGITLLKGEQSEATDYNGSHNLGQFDARI